MKFRLSLIRFRWIVVSNCNQKQNVKRRTIKGSKLNYLSNWYFKNNLITFASRFVVRWRRFISQEPPCFSFNNFVRKRKNNRPVIENYVSEQLALKFTQKPNKRTYSLRVSSKKRMENYYLLLHIESEWDWTDIAGISHISRALLANTKSESETNSVSSADESYPRRDVKKGKLMKVGRQRWVYEPAFVFIIATNSGPSRRLFQSR